MASTMLVSTKASSLRHLLLVALGQEEIGRRIREARESADLTQQDLAGRIGVQTAQSISRYERGETEVPMKRIRRIAEATGKPLDFFITVEPGAPSEVARLERDIQEVKQTMARIERLLAAAAPPAETTSPSTRQASQGTRRARPG